MTCTLHPNVGEVTLETHSKRKGGQYGRQHDAQVGLLASTYTCNCTHMNARVHAHTQKLLPQHLHQLKLNSKALGKIAQMEPCCLVVCFMCIPFILPDTLSDSSRCKPRAEVFSHQPTDTLLSRHLLTVRTRCAGHLHHCPRFGNSLLWGAVLSSLVLLAFFYRGSRTLAGDTQSHPLSSLCSEHTAQATSLVAMTSAAPSVLTLALVPASFQSPGSVCSL